MSNWMKNSVVIVGAGQAGFQTAVSLRDSGFEGRITLVGNEASLPYQRPPLSKSYLLSNEEQENLLLRSKTFFAARRIGLILADEAIKLERYERCLILRSGARLSYDHLVLATGARNRQLPLGLALDDVQYLRTTSDANKIREQLSECNEIVIIGAGFIGLELATVLTKLKKRVVVLDVMPRVMSRAVSSVTAEFFSRTHADKGVIIRTGVEVSGILKRSGKVTGVKTSKGIIFPADMVLAGIGVIPNIELAAAAGLPIHDGIVVNAELQTADPHISAIGDCAEFPSIFVETPIRLESIQNAVDQARFVASRLLQSRTVYASVPWFWSDQADAKLQIVGITSGYDRTVIRGKMSDGKFSVFCFKRDKLVGIESVNSPVDHMFGRKLLGKHSNLTPKQVMDPEFDLKSLVNNIEIDK